MTRPEPGEFRFTLFDDPELVAVLGDLRRAGRGWINIRPDVADEDMPQPPGMFAWLGGSTHHVPTVTWIPGRSGPDGSTRPGQAGLLHASGTRLARRLAELGHSVPAGWRVTQDHPRRGLVLQVPAEADDGEVMSWLLQAAAAASTVPTTGQWLATLHPGLA